MRSKWTVALLCFLCCSAPAEAHSGGVPYGSACGLERWPVKTLMDSQAATLPTMPVATSIGSMSSRHAPPNPDLLVRRRSPIETTLWRVRVRLVGYRLEADSDMHLVLADPGTGRQMIGEIPAAYCTNSPSAKAFSTARSQVERIGHHDALRNRWWWLDYRGATPPLVDVVGYGFWDTLHRQTGAARNGVELHPVMRVQLVK